MKKDGEWPRFFYKIYRVYSPDEEHSHGLFDNEPLYVGWTDDKSMVKAFLEQRNPDKYMVEEWLTDEDDARSAEFHNEWELDIVMLNSNHNKKKKIPLITTSVELHRSIKSIYEMFHEQSMVCDVDDKVLIAWSIFVQLKEEYKEALHFIGYQQEEEEILYDRVEDPYNPESFEGAYTGDKSRSSPFEMCVSTLESLIKVMEFDM